MSGPQRNPVSPPAADTTLVPGWGGPVPLRRPSSTDGNAASDPGRTAWGAEQSIPASAIGGQPGFPVEGLAAASFTLILDTPTIEVETAMVVALELGAPLAPLATSPQNSQAWAKISWVVGQTKFSQYVRVYRSRRLVPLGGARKVQVWGYFFTDGTQAPIAMRAGVAYGDAIDPRADAASWGFPGVVPVAIQQVAGVGGTLGTSPGIVPSAYGLVKAVSGVISSVAAATSLYFMLFDKSSAPVANDIPIPGTTVGPFTAPGAVDGDDDLDPAWFFNTGLWWALSTTPDKLTIPAAGNVGVIAVKVAF